MLTKEEEDSNMIYGLVLVFLRLKLGKGNYIVYKDLANYWIKDE